MSDLYREYVESLIYILDNYQLLYRQNLDVKILGEIFSLINNGDYMIRRLTLSTYFRGLEKIFKQPNMKIFDLIKTLKYVENFDPKRLSATEINNYLEYIEYCRKSYVTAIGLFSGDEKYSEEAMYVERDIGDQVKNTRF